METFAIVMCIIVLIVIVFLIVVEQKNLQKIVTNKRSDEELSISEKRYYELNNKIQLIIVVSSIFLVVGGFFGVNSKISFEKEMKIKTDTLNKYIKKSYDIKQSLIQLQHDYSFNVRTYMVSNIQIPKNVIETYKTRTNEKPLRVKVKFEELKTTEGDSLPAFTKPPFINIQNIGFAFTVMIKEVTPEYFEYEYSPLNTYDEKTGKREPIFPISKFDILITIKK
jgi:flagellar biogenesis protein FliO